MPFTIASQDIIYAAIFAFVFTWLISTLSKVFNIVITHSTEFDFNPKNMENVLRKCYSMFPTEFIKFKGTTFKRGMQVRVTTLQHRTIEGQFIGVNQENMACFITEQSVVAQEVDKIMDMVTVDG